ncbi:hypothetical protein KFU94_30580 [Chloroflexi bacterium TSY]|nr:hypothetical protein [Chloroflexi bacterium TSY]
MSPDSQADDQVQVTAHSVASAVDQYLVALTQDTTLDDADRSIVQHINTTFRNRWWGLFVCYDVSGLPSTNNALEGFFGRLKPINDLSLDAKVLITSSFAMALLLPSSIRLKPKTNCSSGCDPLTGPLIYLNGNVYIRSWLNAKIIFAFAITLIQSFLNLKSLGSLLFFQIQIVMILTPLLTQHNKFVPDFCCN